MVSFDHGNKPWKMKKRKWEVLDGENNTHQITAHFCFNNGNQGLIFRTYPRGSEFTEVTAAFADGSWKFYKESTND